MEKHTFFKLIDKYLAGTATSEERHIVESWYAQLSEGNSSLSAQEQERLDIVVLKLVLEQTQKRRQFQKHSEPKVIPFHRKLWLRYAVASAIILLLGTGVWLMVNNKSKTQYLAALPKEQRYKNDITPASQGVTLTTGDNKKIQLDSLSNGTQLFEDAVSVQKNDHQLTYKPGEGQVAFHTITTGKGKNYNLVLSDGTKVWLDAESTLYFPTAFSGHDRSVNVTGQAYFEVAKNPVKPFRVKFQDKVVEVLGTHFNINAHDKVMQTTLLEGSVRVSSASAQFTILKPGQQTSALPNGEWNTIDNSDIDEVMAWKNGLFHFNGASIKSIMTQLERWYDIKVDYAGNIRDVSLVAKINRNESISRILSLLEMTQQVKFIIDGNKVTIMSVKPARP